MAPASKKMMPLSESTLTLTPSTTISSLFFRSRSTNSLQKKGQHLQSPTVSTNSSLESNSNDFSSTSEDTEEVNCLSETTSDDNSEQNGPNGHCKPMATKVIDSPEISSPEVIDEQPDVVVKCDSTNTPPETPTPLTTIVNYEICCLLAEGSPTCFVSNFSSMIELYEKIAECFDISTKEIMYCTLNTPKIDMEQVLCGQICLNDIVFVHRKGRRKEVEVRKTEPFLGLTIADNGNGCSYIKKIKPNSTASRVPFIKIGDHIESIMGQSMVGHRHFEVAGFLKSIRLNEIFTISLVEPVASDIQLRMATAVKSPMITGLTDAYASVGPRESHSSTTTTSLNKFKLRHNSSVKSEYETNNNIDEEEISHIKCYRKNTDNDDDPLIRTGLYYINKQLEKYLGINDDELAEELWMMATMVTVCHHHPVVNGDENHQTKNKPVIIKHRTTSTYSNRKRQPRNNPHEFAQNIKNSELSDFKFTDDFIFDIWAIINDVCNGRLQLLTTQATVHHQDDNNHQDDDHHHQKQQEK